MWLQEPISLQVRVGNIYNQFESQPVLTDKFPSFPPGKCHNRSLKQAKINSSSLSSGLLHAALFHGIQ
jgi:hypothetical protein